MVLERWKLNNSIYAVGIDGTGEHTVISDGYHNSRAGHGKSGDELLIYSDRSDGNTHIYSLNIAGGTPAQLTFGHYNDTLPAFSPDGSLFAYLRLPDTYSGSTSVKPYELIVK